MMHVRQGLSTYSSPMNSSGIEKERLDGSQVQFRSVSLMKALAGLDLLHLDLQADDRPQWHEPGCMRCAPYASVNFTHDVILGVGVVLHGGRIGLVPIVVSSAR